MAIDSVLRTDTPLTVTEAAASLRAGKVTSVELTSVMIARADALDPTTGTYVTRFDDYAMAQAEQADADFAAGVDKGPFEGIPIGIKDILAMAEGPTTANSLILDRAWGAGKDGPVVSRLKAAGAVITGRVAQEKLAETFETVDLVAKELLGSSRSATSNTLRRLIDNGFLDRVTHGHYAIRPLGSLGTSAATDDLALAVGAAFEGRRHRIAYATALSGFGLLSHPVRTVMVACEQQVRISQIGNRPLRVVIERVETIHLEADIFERTWRSTLERALLESAIRVDLIGSIDRLVEALANGAREADPDRISQLAKRLGPRGLAGERRLATLPRALGLPLGIQREVGRRQPMIHLDPRDERAIWIDNTLRVVGGSLLSGD